MIHAYVPGDSFIFFLYPNGQENILATMLLYQCFMHVADCLDEGDLACIATQFRCIQHFDVFCFRGDSHANCCCTMCGECITFEVLKHEHESQGWISYWGKGSHYFWKPQANIVLCDSCTHRLGCRLDDLRTHQDVYVACADLESGLYLQ